MFKCICLLICCATNALAAPAVTAPTVSVRVDPRIELLSVVQALGDYEERLDRITPFQYPYREDVDRHFERYADHPAVSHLQKMSQWGFTFDAPPTAMLHVSNPPDLLLQVPFSGYLKGRAGGEKALLDLMDHLRSFAEETDFVAFHESKRSLFDGWVASVHSMVDVDGLIRNLEEYYGEKQRSYSIILAPMLQGGYGPRIGREDGSHDVYSIIGPSKIAQETPSFGDEAGFRHIVWHEFGHSFVNPTTAMFRDSVQSSSSLFEPLREAMAAQAYGKWETCVNEHVVRAVVARLVLHEQGPEAADQELQMQKRRRFSYLPAIFDRLVEFERHRSQYPSLREFYPKLLGVFDDLSKAELDADYYDLNFDGTINSVITDSRRPLVVILPTHEGNDCDSAGIGAYLQVALESWWKEQEVLTDDEALDRDLSGRGLVVYGSMEGNSWLRRHRQDLPIRIEPNGVVADSFYPGIAHRVIMACPNPEDRSCGTIVYTAQHPDDLIGIHSVYHGPTGYVIARGCESIRAGNYRIRDGLYGFW